MAAEHTWLMALGLPVLALGLARVLALPLAAWFEVRATRRRRSGPPGLWARWPTVSIIVSAHSEAAVIANCVRSVQASRYERYELIIVDDGSTDNTAELMAGFAAQDGRIVITAQSHAGTGSALNLGIRYATGEILMFLAADAAVTPRTIDRMLQGFEDQRTGAVRGSEGTTEPTSGPARVLDLIRRLGSGTTWRAQSVTGGLPTMSGGMTAVRHAVIAEVGPFREDTAEGDLELGWRVRQAGYRVVFAPRALIRKAGPSNMGALWSHQVRRERSLLQSLWIHKCAIGDLRRRALGDSLMAALLVTVFGPVLQLAGLLTLACLVPLGYGRLGADAWAVLGGVVISATLGVAALELVINGSWGKLRRVWVFPLLPVYAVYRGLALLAALVKELSVLAGRRSGSGRGAEGRTVRNRKHGATRGHLRPVPGRRMGAM
ncbi:glycosyltransferase [Arthrobacter sp. CG_A4]|uniref:glycosyltransferase n=1 Tax=Arthrobacter sp. CG_A4 TaxID=3071706 RepID=UPI002DFCC520|nr:biofilm PGA synthesis N-glycosyltransferase PgaC [Arthrobacter sp. CG_A4]